MKLRHVFLRGWVINYSFRRVSWMTNVELKKNISRIVFAISRGRSRIVEINYEDCAKHISAVLFLNLPSLLLYLPSYGCRIRHTLRGTRAIMNVQPTYTHPQAHDRKH